MENNREKQPNGRRKRIVLSVCCILMIVGVAGVYLYREYRKTHITTDDAFIAGRIHAIASKIPGTVEKLHVHDNQYVRTGDILLEIDDRDYALAVSQARAALEAEKAKTQQTEIEQDVAGKRLMELNFTVESARAEQKLQEARFIQAGKDIERARSLFDSDVLPEDQYEKAVTEYDIASARLDAAEKQVRRAQGAVETQKAVIEQIRTSLDAQRSTLKKQEEFLKAQILKASYTKLYAPVDGYISKRSVEIGNEVQTGQALMAVVPLDDIWITANYKETQLEMVRPGQSVRIRVDTFPDKVFTGTVESIMAGTGSVFSLFPPENATGNYVKVVQRIPVKIVLDEDADPEHTLRIGMSVVLTINTGS